MMDNYQVVPNRAKRRKHKTEVGSIGHIEKPIDKYKEQIIKKIEFKKYLERGRRR